MARTASVVVIIVLIVRTHIFYVKNKRKTIV